MRPTSDELDIHFLSCSLVARPRKTHECNVECLSHAHNSSGKIEGPCSLPVDGSVRFELWIK